METYIMSTLQKLNETAWKIRRCKLCSLHKDRIQAVPGIGSYSSHFLFIGQNPGTEEDQAGIPFVGESGTLLHIWIKYLQLQEKDYAITNIVKCKTPENRRPSHPEIKTCSYWLKKQLNLLTPQIIIAVGIIPSYYFLGHKYRKGILTYGGHFYKVDKKDYTIFPIPHPSYFLRKGSKEEEWMPYLHRLSEYIKRMRKSC